MKEHAEGDQIGRGDMSFNTTEERLFDGLSMASQVYIQLGDNRDNPDLTLEDKKNISRAQLGLLEIMDQKQKTDLYGYISERLYEKNRTQNLLRRIR